MKADARRRLFFYSPQREPGYDHLEADIKWPLMALSFWSAGSRDRTKKGTYCGDDLDLVAVSARSAPREAQAHARSNRVGNPRDTFRQSGRHGGHNTPRWFPLRPSAFAVLRHLRQPTHQGPAQRQAALALLLVAQMIAGCTASCLQRHPQPPCHLEIGFITSTAPALGSHAGLEHGLSRSSSESMSPICRAEAMSDSRPSRRTGAPGLRSQPLRLFHATNSYLRVAYRWTRSAISDRTGSTTHQVYGLKDPQCALPLSGPNCSVLGLVHGVHGHLPLKLM